MAADYSLLGQGFSAANALAALGAGQQRQLQQVQLQRQEEEYQRQQAERQRQETFRREAQSAYDPTTGRFDAAKVRGAYAAIGDVGGAVAFDKSQIDQRAAQYKTAVEQAAQTAQLLNGVTDEASYQRARLVAQQQGLDVSKVPSSFDPQWVQTMRAQALTVQQQLAAERDRWVPIGERGLLNVSNPEAVAAYQRSQGQPQQQSGPQVGMVEDGYRFKGGNPADPASWEQVGGASPQGGASFP